MSIFNTLAEQALAAIEQGDVHGGVEMLKQGAESGDAAAQYHFGLLHANGKGEGAALNYVLAASWILKAANQGLPEAQSTLGWLYASGYGVDQSNEIAGQWYIKAAEGGLAKDQYMVASMYRWGRNGVEKDYAKALEWYQRAAAQGHAGAQAALGRLCMEGELGIVKDLVTAFQWLTLATLSGNATAAKSLEELQSRMSSEQLTEAKARMMGAAGQQE